MKKLIVDRQSKKDYFSRANLYNKFVVNKILENNQIK
jgi:hypothetical protein